MEEGAPPGHPHPKATRQGEDNRAGHGPNRPVVVEAKTVGVTVAGGRVASRGKDSSSAKGVGATSTPYRALSYRFTPTPKRQKITSM